MAKTAEYLTVTQAAERLNCSQSHIRALIALHNLKAISISSGDDSYRPTYRITVASLDAFIKDRTVAE